MDDFLFLVVELEVRPIELSKSVDCVNDFLAVESVVDSVVHSFYRNSYFVDDS